MSQHPVKVDPLAPGEDCWGKPSAFLALLAKKLFVDLPAGIIAKLWQGPSEPPADKKDWLWFNETTKGKPVGFFSFYKGKQVPVWPSSSGTVAPVMVFNGRVDAVKPPFTFCDGREGTPDMTVQMLVLGTLAAPVAADYISGILADGDVKDEVEFQIGYMQLTGYTD